MNQPILILSALERELEAVRESMTDVDEVEISGHTFWRGTIAGSDVVGASVGIGKVNAAMVTTLAIDHFAPGVILFTGVAGGLDPALMIGDIVIAESVVQYDTGIAGPNGFRPYQPGHLPFFNPTERVGYEPSSALLDRARAAVDAIEFGRVHGRTPRFFFGTVATGDQFIESEADRRRIRDVFGAHAVEMEGAAVAQVAGHFGVDHLVIRAVSDLAGPGSEVDFDRFLAEVTTNSLRVVRALLASIAATP